MILAESGKKPQVIVLRKETAAKENIIEKHGSNRRGACLSRLDFASNFLPVTKLPTLKKQVMFCEDVLF